MEIKFDNNSNDINEDDLIKKDAYISMLISVTTFEELNEYLNRLIIEGDKTFTSITQIIRYVVQNIQKKGYEKYTSAQSAYRNKKLAEIKKIKSKTFTMKVHLEMYKYWRTIPKGFKKPALENAIYKLILKKQQ